jgi:hypothetical protein
MTVKFLQSGGFGGLFKGCDLNTEQLSAEQALELEGLVKRSGLSDSQEQRSTSARDLRQYELTIEAGSKKFKVIFDDETLPADAKPLVNFLLKLSKPKSP